MSLICGLDVEGVELGHFRVVFSCRLFEDGWSRLATAFARIGFWDEGGVTRVRRGDRWRS